MKAVQVSAPGGPEVLQLVDRPDPVPGPDDLLVEVAACGVNFIDTYQRGGLYQVPMPAVLGAEGAGRVLGIGSGVEGFAVGDRVAWQGVGGSYAERVAGAGRPRGPGAGWRLGRGGGGDPPAGDDRALPGPLDVRRAARRRGGRPRRGGRGRPPADPAGPQRRRPRRGDGLDPGQGRAVPRRGRRARRGVRRRPPGHGARGHRRRGSAGRLRRRRRGDVRDLAAVPAPPWPARAVRSGQRAGAAVRPPAAEPGRVAVRHSADARATTSRPARSCSGGRASCSRPCAPASWTCGSARRTRSPRPGRPTRTSRAAGRPERSCCCRADRRRPRLRALHRTRPAGRLGHRGVAHGGGLLRRSACGPARAAPAGRPGTGAPRGDLRPRVQVEQLDRLDQARRPRPAARTPPRRPASPPRPPAPHPAEPVGTSKAVVPATTSGAAATSRSRSISAAHVRGGSSSRSTTFGCSSPAWPTSRPSARRRAAHRPGCQGAWSASAATSTSTWRASATDRARATASDQSAGAALAPPAAHLAVTAQGDGQTRRLRRDRGLELGQLRLRRPPVDRGPGRGDGRAGRPGHQAELEQRHVPVAAADVAPQHRQQRRQQRGPHLRLLLGERVREPQRPAPGIVGGAARTRRGPPARRTGSSAPPPPRGRRERPTRPGAPAGTGSGPGPEGPRAGSRGCGHSPRDGRPPRPGPRPAGGPAATRAA